MVTCTFTLNGFSVHVLFDTGASFSFVSTAFMPKLAKSLSPLSRAVMVKVVDDRYIRVKE